MQVRSWMLSYVLCGPAKHWCVQNQFLQGASGVCSPGFAMGPNNWNHPKVSWFYTTIQNLWASVHKAPPPVPDSLWLCPCLMSIHGWHFMLTGGNWQKWKRVFLTCPCHKIYRDEAVGLKSCKNTWKITIFVKMWNLGQYRENLIFCQ